MSTNWIHKLVDKKAHNDPEVEQYLIRACRTLKDARRDLEHIQNKIGSSTDRNWIFTTIDKLDEIIERVEYARKLGPQ